MSKIYLAECVSCKSKENLTAHHIFPKSFCKNQSNIWNGFRFIALCKKCHYDLHNKRIITKGIKDAVDLRIDKMIKDLNVWDNYKKRKKTINLFIRAKINYGLDSLNTSNKTIKEKHKIL